MLSLRDKARLVKLYYLNSECASAALRTYRSMRGIKRGKGPMSCSSLIAMMERFEDTGRLDARARSGRPKKPIAVVHEVEHEAATQSAASAHGECSAREISRRTGISYGTVWRSLRIILKRYPYKIQHVQELKPTDYGRRHEFANWAFQQMENNADWLSNVLWTDEAHFSLNGSVNAHNCRIWARENPHAIGETPLHQSKVTAWCGFTASFIIGPFFFEEVHSGTFRTVSVTGKRYAALLRDNIIPSLQAREALHSVTFMQDGAPPHITGPVQHLLRSTFGDDRVLSRSFPHEWPPRSPDLTPCDFWLWGYLKSQVYRGRPTSLAMLKEAIRHHVTGITAETLFDAVHSVVPRLTAILMNDGRHIEHL